MHMVLLMRLRKKSRNTALEVTELHGRVYSKSNLFYLCKIILFSSELFVCFSTCICNHLAIPFHPYSLLGSAMIV